MPIAALTLAVVGADHLNKKGPTRRFEIALCRPGEPVHLVPEPKNPADPNAIAVYSERGVQLGYVRAERAPLIGGYLSRGVEVRAIFQEPARWGANIRVAFDGDEPVLPAKAAAPSERIDESDDRQATNDWWPDEEWPDT